jgi:hypothetical protein
MHLRSLHADKYEKRGPKMRWMRCRATSARPYSQVPGVTPLPILLLVAAERYQRTRQRVARRHRMRDCRASAPVGDRDPRQRLEREEIPLPIDQSRM